MIIYGAINQKTGEMYVGATKATLSERKSGHYYTAKSFKRKCKFHRALLKYDEKDFQWIIIEEVDNEEDLERLEIYYIGYYDTFNNGYNETLGGKGSIGYTHSIESIKKMTGENHPMSGKHHSVETKKKMSEAQSGEKHPFYGKKFSKEHRANISKNHADVSGENHPQAREVIIDDMVFDTRKEAAEFIGITPSAIRYRILHKTKWLGYKYET